MPELPEVETIVKQLNKLVVGKRLESAKVISPGQVDQSLEKVMPSLVTKAWRRAKAIILELEGRKCLLIRLGMTGHFHYAPAGKKWKYQNGDQKYALVHFFFQDGSVLSYTDIRKFGSVRLLNKLGLQEKLQKFGPEPLGREFSAKVLGSLLAKKKKANIKATLMDQKVIAGIGNIYAQEALYRAGISPKRKAGTLKEKEIQRLHQAVQEVLQQSIAHNGTTVENYVHIEGAGGFQKYLTVYGKEECPRKHKLTKIYLGGRGTYYCGKCQLDSISFHLL